MMTLALGWFSASLTGRRERMEMRDIEGDWRASERMAAPAVPVAPVRIMWDISLLVVPLEWWGMERDAWVYVRGGKCASRRR